jgi:hypothetical protein
MWHDGKTKDENWGLQETITKMLKWVQQIIFVGVKMWSWLMSSRNGEILNWDFN